MKDLGKISLLLVLVVVVVYFVFSFQTAEVMFVKASNNFVELVFSDGRTMEISYSTFIDRFEDKIPQEFQPVEWDSEARMLIFANGKYVGYWAHYGGCQGIEVYRKPDNMSVRCFEHRNMNYLLR